MPETATVISFDGTPIHVNFFPAAGLKAEHRARDGARRTRLGIGRRHQPQQSPAPDSGYSGSARYARPASMS